MIPLVTWLLALGVPDWAVLGIVCAVLVGGFGAALGIGLWLDNYLRGLRRFNDWHLPSEPAVLRPPAYWTPREAEPEPEEVPMFHKPQAG